MSDLQHRIPGYSYRSPLIKLLYISIAVVIVTIAATFYFSFLFILVSFELLFLVVYLLALSLMAMGGRSPDEYQKVTYGREGIRVNGNLLHPWNKVSLITYVRVNEKLHFKKAAFPGYSPGRAPYLVRSELYPDLPELTHSYKYGRIEIYPSNPNYRTTTIRTTYSLFRLRRIFGKMQKYAAFDAPEGFKFRIEDEDEFNLVEGR